MTTASPRYLLILAGLVLLLTVAFLSSLAFGSVPIPLRDLVPTLFGQTHLAPTHETILLQFRLPRSITALLAGAALALSGLQLQALFRNPLAGPYILGIHAGASLGVALLVLGTGVAAAEWTPPSGASTPLSSVTAAILGATVVMSLVLWFARWVTDSASLLLVGLMVGYGTSALASVLLHFAQAESIRSFVLWSMGSFGGVSRSHLGPFIISIGVGAVLSLLCLKSMNALLLGETYATSMGVSVPTVRVAIVASTSILAGTVTAYCGPIAFLGLAVPHIGRGLLATGDQRLLALPILLLGGTVALAADVVARVPGHEWTLPLNAVTAFVGAPIVIAVILNRKRTAMAQSI